MNSFVLRRATPDDAPALTECIGRAYAPYVGRIADLPPVTEGVGDDIAKHLVWVAVSAGQVVGGVVLVITSESAHLANVAVDPDMRGTGLGRALIAQAEAESRRRGLGVIQLATHVDMPENVALYRHLGWREIGRDGRKVLMDKAL